MAQYSTDFKVGDIVNNPRCPWHGDQDYIFSKVKEDVSLLQY